MELFDASSLGERLLRAGFIVRDATAAAGERGGHLTGGEPQAAALQGGGA